MSVLELTLSLRLGLLEMQPQHGWTGPRYNLRCPFCNPPQDISKQILIKE